MLQFEIKILIAYKPVTFQVEELNPWPDDDGYVRYSVSNDHHSSVIAIDTSYFESPYILTEEDAWYYLEKILYPEFGRVYSEDLVFTGEELELIRKEIGKYITAIKS